VVNEHESGVYDYADRISLDSRGLRTTNYQKEYSALCTDLKQLYVCITRPKKRLIIYDEDPSTRDIALNYWMKLDAVDVITEDFIRQSQQQTEKSTLTEEQRLLISKLKEG